MANGIQQWKHYKSEEFTEQFKQNLNVVNKTNQKTPVNNTMTYQQFKKMYEDHLKNSLENNEQAENVIATRNRRTIAN